ncbi:RHS repeat-associated core domain-containing protein [Acidovorax sp. BLS4]|uniref:RHS repeat-associated core domain-containing protein n=1 Tax=Acidovorax sp. BLS4 TaxID=3273430 RepID=UPI002943BFF8|nr:RHS repeat-associated core domain-containing protein [Paracidovorax avenae]WOI45170.1 RHS repeat-associated core domain-containing protein [Paracidovorax avenae]
MTDAQGRIAWAADYKVWGEATLRTIARTGTDDRLIQRRMGHGPGTDHSNGASSSSSVPPPIEQPFRFQGQQLDEETGLHYNRFRYYDAAVGRFVSQDPIGLMGGTNASIYAPNSINWVDQLGLRSKRDRRKCPCEDKRTCDEIYKDALSTSIGRKETQGSRGVLERVEHLQEDKLDLFRRAKSESFKGKGGSLDGVGTWDGHLNAANEVLENLKYDIEAYDTKGCGSSHKKLPQATRDASRINIPTVPGR